MSELECPCPALQNDYSDSENFSAAKYSKIALKCDRNSNTSQKCTKFGFCWKKLDFWEKTGVFSKTDAGVENAVETVWNVIISRKYFVYQNKEDIFAKKNQEIFIFRKFSEARVGLTKKRFKPI